MDRNFIEWARSKSSGETFVAWTMLLAAASFPAYILGTHGLSHYTSMAAFHRAPYVIWYLSTALVALLGLVIQDTGYHGGGMCCILRWWELRPVQHWALMGLLIPCTLHLLALRESDLGAAVDWEGVVKLAAYSGGWSLAVLLGCGLLVAVLLISHGLLRGLFRR